MDRNEIRRLQKAAKDGNKLVLGAWASQFEDNLRRMYDREYERAFQQELISSIDNFMTAVAYAALFSEETKLNKDTLPSFMEDVYVTLDMYRTGEYNPKEYKKTLEENGVQFEDYCYRKKHRKTITLCGSTKFKDDFMKKQQELTLEGWIVLSVGVFGHADKVEITAEQKEELDRIHKDKIELSDAIYVINRDGYIGNSTKSEIKFAREKGKTIYYMEDIDKS